MENGLLHLHNFLRWAVLVFGILALYRGATGLGGCRPYVAADGKISTGLLVSTHIQFLLGITLYFLRDWAPKLVSGDPMVMKNPVWRFWTIEHGPVMILAVVFITIGHSSAKRATVDKTKFKRWFWWTLAGFIIILSAVPWPWRELVGRGWFPGMTAGG